ncbi:variant surface glycoprotein (VSG), putative [Trypanosoma brucei brucei TREU927]|uniref:Variant surface glycoprotein (VSG), putative n=1 Tax=Trypanosoma brucei brucei (strain 927/4 GUTat10.1) TaxID=185431 RepID=Q4FKF2_TRYB2|nr:variant surface glycoprotein [Trypanosoma brucei brucei TREU927]EAN80666.1 variant surface glycoprotein (VSG), putative [Trypanosoma brucei brucei TREU927]CAJ17042.1 variant surface glycoprotein (VSG), putative [Trypanosoma brucei brucei TREU927]
MDLLRWTRQTWLQTFIIIAGVNASAPAFNEGGIQRLCGVATDLSGVAGIGVGKVADQKRHLEAALNAQKALTVAALAERNTAKAMIFAPAAGKAGHCAVQAAQQAAVLADKALMATKAAAGVGGHITGIVELLLKATKQTDGTAGKCIVKDDTATATEHSTTGGLGCPTTTDEPTARKTLADLKNLNEQGFAKLTAEKKVVDGTATSACAFLIGSNNQATHIWDHGGSDNNAVTIAHGILKLKFHNTQSSESAVTTQLNELGTWGAGGDTDNHKLFKAIGGLVKEDVHACGETTDKAIKNFLEPQSLKTSLSEAYKKTGEKTAEKQAEEEINKATDKAKATADDLKAILEKVEIPKLKDGEITTKTLKQLNYNVDDTANLLSSLLQLKAKSEASTSCPKFDPKEDGKSSTETDETCETKGTGADCKDGCKVEGTDENKKCVNDPDYRPKQVEATKMLEERNARTKNRKIELEIKNEMVVPSKIPVSLSIRSTL